MQLKAHVESRVRKYVSTNVVGRVAGSSADPENAVLYTAHYDHLGIDPDAKGDGIYNGAADNGTGCGILLELARAFAQSAERPPHAMYFSAVTAEEQGLLGSQYLGEHPPVPARDIALDLNYDMLLPIGVPLSASLGGAERIDFWPTIQTVAKDFDLKLLPDPDPSAGHYYRSRSLLAGARGDSGVLHRPGASSSRVMMRRGGARSLMTSWRTTITSLRMSITLTGISAATRRWRGLDLCWAGWRARKRSRWSGRPAMSSKRRERRARRAGNRD